MRSTIIILYSLIFNTGFSQSPSESLQRLIDGNQRYVNNVPLGANRHAERRAELLEEQKPFAVILSCSDSRVPPELIFDQGLGDLFIVRVAGNVSGSIELDSIDYSAKYLGSSLVLVLGHESCGAITAVMKGKTADIKNIAALIKPAINGATSLEDAIKSNVQKTVARLKKTPFLEQLISEKKIDCVGAYYHLDTGAIEILK